MGFHYASDYFDSVVIFKMDHGLGSGTVLRANVTIGQTFRGNSSKFNLAHILRLGRP